MVYTGSMAWSRPPRSFPVVFAVVLATLGLHAGLLWFMMSNFKSAPALPPERPITVEMIARTPASVVATNPSAKANPSPDLTAARSPAAGAARGSEPLRAGRSQPVGSPSPDPQGTTAISTGKPPDSVPSAGADSHSAALAGDFGGNESQTAREEFDDDSLTSPRSTDTDRAVNEAGATTNPFQTEIAQAAPASTSSASDQASAAAAAPAMPMEGRWRYQVFYGDFSENRPVAVLDYVMSLRDGAYSLYTEGHAQGLLALFYRGSFKQSSRGRLDPEGFHPEEYAEQRGDRSARAVHISAGLSPTARFDDGRSVPIGPNAQDRLSLGAQLAWLASTGSSLMREARITVELIGVSSIRRVHFDVVRDQMLLTHSGMRRLVKLRSEDDDGGAGSGSLEVWLTEEGSLMPYRIRLEDRRGQILDQVLTNG